MERGVFAFACQYIVSLRGRTGNRTVTQMQNPLLVEGRPECAPQSLASTLSAPRVAATSYCDPLFAYPLFKCAQNFDPPNHPKPPQTPNFPENPVLPRIPPGIPTELIYYKRHTLRGPNWGLFCPEIRAFTGRNFFNRFQSPW